MRFSLLLTIIVMSFIIGCSGWAIWHPTTSNDYSRQVVEAKGMRQVDISLIENAGGKVIGYINSGGDENPAKHARALATQYGGTHYIFAGEHTIYGAKYYECLATKSKVFGTEVINTRCAEGQEEYTEYRYNVYVVPQENWGKLPDRLKPELKGK